MSIDFTLTPELEKLRLRVRDVIDTVVRPAEERMAADKPPRDEYLRTIFGLRKQAREAGIWLPHMPEEWGGMGLGHVELAMVQAEAAKSRLGPWVFNCQAPDEGNMHTLVHWGTDEQKEKYLRPLCEGRASSCFAMTEPEVAGSDPTLIQTRAYQDGDEWVINGHKWFISNAHRAQFAILVCRTEDDPDLPQAANSAFIVDIPSEGWEEVREVETMHGSTGHSEIRITDLRVHDDAMLGGRGQGHLLGQYRLGPARLAHCMRWIAQAETALDMMVDRSLNRFAHGSLLAEKQMVFGGLLGSTFNYVFELQMEDLQFGDRFYYLFRNQGNQLFAALEANSFSSLIQRNTDASLLPAEIFRSQEPTFDLENLPTPLPAAAALR